MSSENIVPCSSDSSDAKRARTREAFLLALAGSGHVAKSARAARISRKTAYEWRNADAAFAQAWEHALVEAVGVLEDAARHRAVEGVLKPVYQGGVKVGSVREYSDVLLITLLKAHAPEKYRERADVNVSGLTVFVKDFTGRPVKAVDAAPPGAPAGRPGGWRAEVLASPASMRDSTDILSAIEGPDAER